MPLDANTPLPDAPELMERIAREPSLDELMARSPQRLKDMAAKQGVSLAKVLRLRADRAAWEQKRGETNPAPTSEE